MIFPFPFPFLFLFYFRSGSQPVREAVANTSQVGAKVDARGVSMGSLFEVSGMRVNERSWLFSRWKRLRAAAKLGAVGPWFSCGLNGGA